MITPSGGTWITGTWITGTGPAETETAGDWTDLSTWTELSTWTDLVVPILHFANVAIIIYFFLINTGYLILIGMACADVVQHRSKAAFTGDDETYASPFTMPISVIVPAYNEAAGIVEAVRALHGLRYPKFEVIVVDDGSADATFDELRDAFDLVEVPFLVPDEVPVEGAVRSVHLPRVSAAPLLVVRKDNGGRSDSLNVGINVASYPLVCMVDADSILDPRSLLTVAKPFSDDPAHVVATGGVVRIANGCTTVAGRVVDARIPDTWLPRIQVVEYLRAFLLGRAGWSRLGCLTVISGAFGLFRRDLLVELGGLDRHCMGEDAELVVRVHRRMRELDRAYRVVFVAEPICWSEAPTTFSELGRQRRRWHRGLTEILIKHRRLIGNPRYGRIGLVALPYLVIFELLAPLVEVSGLVLVPVSFVFGVVNLAFALMFLLIAYGYSMLVNMVAITADEYFYHPYRRWRDIGAMMLAGLIENIGFRQLTVVWRLRGAWGALRRSEQVWGTMSRRGFKAGEEAAKPAVTHPRSGVTAGRTHPRAAGAPQKKKAQPTKKSRDQSR
jgi:cellulose synthase/poly-beta-1,6-N-acetylglucosamine synthase-like glycosyltransferase